MTNKFKSSISLETNVDHLDFYKQNNISPVEQDVEDIQLFFERRSSLYRHLGIIDLLVKSKDVIEIGPGSGHNSLYTASLLPNNYVLVEPNPTGSESILRLYEEFSSYNIQYTTPTLVKKMLEDLSLEYQYDIAISEGWMGISKHERQMMQRFGQLVKPRGVLVTTLASGIGSLPNALRRILSYILTRDSDSFEQKTELIVLSLSSHLSTLKNMTRPYVDWAHDCMLNPGFMTISPTPEMFIEDMGDSFSIYNSYPNFYTDWRWYKSLHGNNRDFNQNFLNQYWEVSHNFFDCNRVYPKRDPSSNIELELLCFDLLNLIINLEESGDLLLINKIVTTVEKISENLRELSMDYADAVDEFLKLVNNNLISPKTVSEMEKLRNIFGRELLYISAIKDKGISDGQ